MICICYTCPNSTVRHFMYSVYNIFDTQVWCSAVKYEEGGTESDVQGGFHASHPAGLLVPQYKCLF